MRTLFLALLMMTSLGCHSTQQSSTKTEPFIGIISASQLIKQYPKFSSEYEQYQPSSAEMTAAKSLSGMSVVVLFGTWCHDSEREVPRLLKLLDLSGVELERLSLHALNYNKQDPNNLHLQYDLKYTPTIILLKGEDELGRIIEKPVESIGEDLAGFVGKS